MSLKAEIVQIIRDTVPGCVAAHDRDGFDKLHDGDISALADAIVKHVKSRKKSK